MEKAEHGCRQMMVIIRSGGHRRVHGLHVAIPESRPWHVTAALSARVRIVINIYQGGATLYAQSAETSACFNTTYISDARGSAARAGAGRRGGAFTKQTAGPPPSICHPSHSADCAFEILLLKRRPRGRE
ncbi:hypothetical protein EVAR_67321_1 [Eumeta japonica]|uniref:Uncharacterized protein n=1 Tax=Eumeta variegata TaxID=151549 RepID=A0A4C1ZC77_EUMVA|nr:hypothetical protein EVAR_67321_1 [Eumeta japonica]